MQIEPDDHPLGIAGTAALLVAVAMLILGAAIGWILS